jgi:hypothetical protein
MNIVCYRICINLYGEVKCMCIESELSEIYVYNIFDFISFEWFNVIFWQLKIIGYKAFNILFVWI